MDLATTVHEYTASFCKKMDKKLMRVKGKETYLISQRNLLYVSRLQQYDKGPFLAWDKVNIE